VSIAPDLYARLLLSPCSDFEGDRAGKFALALPEEEDHVVIFEFSFENRSAGYFVSQGLWKDDHRGETGKDSLERCRFEL